MTETHHGTAGASPTAFNSTQFAAMIERVGAFISAYHEGIAGHPVLSQAEPGDVLRALPDHPPELGGDEDELTRALDDIDRSIIPALTHWQSPTFFAYFPCNASIPAILGELLAAGLNVNGMLWSTSPAATELETRMLDWAAHAFGLPDSFLSNTPNAGGCIQGTASEATLVAMCAARQRLRDAGRSVEHAVVYTSTQAHSSVLKAAMIAGIAASPEDSERVRLIETDADHAMDPAGLRAAMDRDIADGRVPMYVCATLGTTSSCAVDPLAEIAEVVRSVGAPKPWLHVDAAFMGAQLICPEHRGFAGGLEHADSLCINPHKWLLTNFDCDLFWTSDVRSLTGALSITPEYLRNRATDDGAVIDYRDWQVPLGRKFRALKLWFVFRQYGLEGLRSYIREHLRLAELFESWIENDPGFEMAAPRTSSLICFRALGDDDLNRRLLEAINRDGRIMLSHTTLAQPEGPPRYVLRLAIGATATRQEHVELAWHVIRELAAALRDTSG